MNNIYKIKEMLDKLNEELESLRAENHELKLRLSKYELVAKTEKDEKDDSFETSSDFSNEQLYELGESIIKHTTKNEIQAITQLMYYWENNKTPNNLPGKMIRAVISSQSLSEKSLDVICKFIVSAITEKFTSRLEKAVNLTPKYSNMVIYLLDNGNLSDETYETLLDVYFKHNISSNKGCYWRKNLANLFAKSSRYNVVEISTDSGFRIEKK